MPDIRSLAPELRTANLYYHMDPCFEDTDKCYATFGAEVEETHRELTDPTRSSSDAGFLDHLLVDLSFEWCGRNQTTTLGRRLLSPVVGDVFCSIERLSGDERIYEQDDLRLPVSLPYRSEFQVELRLRPEHILGETGWLLLSRESELTLVGLIHEVHDSLVVVDPLIIGSPTFEHPRNSENPSTELLSWYALTVFETLPEDVDEFAALKADESAGESAGVETLMRNLSSADHPFLAAQLNQALPHANLVEVDPGCMTGLLHVGGRPMTTAILLSGDSSSKALTADQLGLADSRLRILAARKEDLLILQHRHEIDPGVRDAIREFVLVPNAPQRYCLLDGRDTCRILEAAARD